MTAGGFTVEADGMQVTGGVSVRSVGMVITGGLTVNGNTFLSTAYTVFSDRRLKENISNINDALSKISRIRGVYYSWRQNEDFVEPDHDRHVGVIAQEIQEVLPEAVKQMQYGRYLGVSYDGLIPLLIEAIKELDSRNIDPLDTEEDIFTFEDLVGRESQMKAADENLLKRVQDLEDFVEKMKLEGKHGDNTMKIGG